MRRRYRYEYLAALNLAAGSAAALWTGEPGRLFESFGAVRVVALMVYFRTVPCNSCVPQLKVPPKAKLRARRPEIEQS